MKYVSICHPKFGAMIVQFSPHVTHIDFLAALGNPPCLGAASAMLPDGVSPTPIGQSQSLGKSPAMPDAKLLEQGYRLTRIEHDANPLFSQS